MSLRFSCGLVLGRAFISFTFEFNSCSPAKGAVRVICAPDTVRTKHNWSGLSPFLSIQKQSIPLGTEGAEPGKHASPCSPCSPDDSRACARITDEGVLQNTLVGRNIVGWLVVPGCFVSSRLLTPPPPLPPLPPSKKKKKRFLERTEGFELVPVFALRSHRRTRAGTSRSVPR